MRRPSDTADETVNVPALHCGVQLLETADEMLMDTLQGDKRTAPYILSRLSPTIAVVSPGGMDKLVAALEKAGHLARVVPVSTFSDWHNQPGYDAASQWDEEYSWYDEPEPGSEDDEDWDDEDEDWDDDDDD